jgi:nucleotide-binding universal stress UspA family protein
LVNAGIGADRIDTHVVTGVSSRAAAIVKEARDSGCGTIVMGRKGLSEVSGFFIGRVSDKVIHLGRVYTVWVSV